jgi:uncharacterized protein YdeI (YjbR/CyaY-like superfamily)
MAELEKIHFESEEQFREWLKINYNKSRGIWLVFYKKHTGVKSIGYHEALDVALCYGWIDSIIKRRDDSTYARKFTPRTNTLKWSEYNKKRLTELIKSGKMTDIGLSKAEGFPLTGNADPAIAETRCTEKNNLIIPEFIISEFAINEPALSNFKKLAPTYQRHYVLWITSAKRDITIRSRLDESIILLKENKKLGLK